MSIARISMSLIWVALLGYFVWSQAHEVYGKLAATLSTL